MNLGLDGRAFVVTGASRGIGAETARLLSAEGAAVLLVARGVEALARSARACSGPTAALALDVTAADAGERIVAECLRYFGRVDGLVNNAGGAEIIAAEALTDADWQGQLDLHVMAPMRLMRAACPQMAAAGWGRVVNVCSTVSKLPEDGNAAYSVSKAAQLSLSRLAADEWAARGVRVNAVLPGVTETEMWIAAGGVADELASIEGKSAEQVLDEVRGTVPTGQLGTELEVASVIVFLCSELAANVAGAAWTVDGGFVPTMI
jgi:3-oxoacyl-[acyl-carrier protein] reductase